MQDQQERKKRGDGMMMVNIYEIGIKNGQDCWVNLIKTESEEEARKCFDEIDLSTTKSIVFKSYVKNPNPTVVMMGESTIYDVVNGKIVNKLSPLG